jgi:hypothetical protein
MKKPSTPTITDEAVAFVIFLICCVISFFRHPAVADFAFTLAN